MQLAVVHFNQYFILFEYFYRGCHFDSVALWVLGIWTILEENKHRRSSVTAILTIYKFLFTSMIVLFWTGGKNGILYQISNWLCKNDPLSPYDTNLKPCIFLYHGLRWDPSLIFFTCRSSSGVQYLGRNLSDLALTEVWCSETSTRRA